MRLLTMVLLFAAATGPLLAAEMTSAPFSKQCDVAEAVIQIKGPDALDLLAALKAAPVRPQNPKVGVMMDDAERVAASKFIITKALSEWCADPKRQK